MPEDEDESTPGGIKLGNLSTALFAEQVDPGRNARK